jgi:hypothetical protein
LQLLAPGRAATLTDTTTLTFAWTPLPDARWYRLRIAQGQTNILNRRFDDPAVLCSPESCVVDFASLGITLEPGKRYRWWIAAKPAGRAVARSNQRRFSLANATDNAPQSAFQINRPFGDEFARVQQTGDTTQFITFIEDFEDAPLEDWQKRPQLDPAPIGLPILRPRAYYSEIDTHAIAARLNNGQGHIGLRVDLAFDKPYTVTEVSWGYGYAYSDASELGDRHETYAELKLADGRTRALLPKCLVTPYRVPWDATPCLSFFNNTGQQNVVGVTFYLQTAGTPPETTSSKSLFLDDLRVVTDERFAICPQLENFYGSSPDFARLLYSETPGVRADCLSLYSPIIFLALYHELQSNQFINLQDIPQLNGKSLQRTAGGSYTVAIDATHTAPFVVAPTPPAQPPPGEEPVVYPAFENQYNLYYAFTRAMLNGILENYAKKGQNPMAYFGTNFNSTVNKDEKWLEVEPFCGGIPTAIVEVYEVDLNGNQRLAYEYCADREWYADVVTNVSPYRERYLELKGTIEAAILDEVNGVFDPTNDAFNAKPTNRIWYEKDGIDSPLNFTRDGITGKKIYGPISESNHSAYVLDTYMTRVTKRLWLLDSAPDPSVASGIRYRFYPWANYATGESGIWQRDATDTDGPEAFKDYWVIPGCDIQETIAQAYMRHLREIYSPDTYLTLQSGGSIPNLNANQVLFGLSTGTSAIHMHAVIPEVPQNSTNIVAIKWSSFKFEKALEDQGQRASTVPLRRDGTTNGQEFSIGVTPLECP